MVKSPQPYVMPLSGGGTPVSGEIDINANGVHDVAAYATANVNVPQPSGTIDITTNGEHNVAQYEKANVAVPQPSGTIKLTVNGDFDVTNYSLAQVRTPTPSTYIKENRGIVVSALPPIITGVT